MPLRSRLWLILVLAFYATLSLWRMHVSPFPAHNDACWYDMVARNVAQGRGLVEDCIWHYALPMQSVSHPIGNYWNPLCPLIVGGFYKLFGISDLVGKLPVFLMDGILCAGLFLFCLSRWKSLPIAILSSLLFTSHPYLLAFRGGGGFPESMLLFFVTCCCYCLIWAYEGRKIHYITAAAFGALAYLARNEGGVSLLVILMLWFDREIIQPRCSGRPWNPKSVGWLAAALGTFGLIVLPWEIRNHLLFGAAANAAKYHFFLARQYEDIWSYSQTFSWHQYWAMGPAKIASLLLTSYDYKLDAFIQITSWPLAIFLPMGLLAARRMSWTPPIYIYFLMTYLFMGAVNNIGQNAGWNGAYTFLPFFIPLAVVGIDFFSRTLCSKPSRATALMLTLGSSIVLYQLADNVRFLHRYHKSAGDAKRITMQVAKDWFIQHPSKVPPVVMDHYAYELTYFTGIPAVKIPTHDPLDKVWEVAAKYHCTHLILFGDNDAVFHSIYTGETSDPHLKRLAVIPFHVTMENGGDQIQIYQLQ